MKNKFLFVLCLSLAFAFPVNARAEENLPAEDTASLPSVRILSDGSYTPSVKCISALCGAVSCTLNVTEGEMYANLILDNEHVKKIYPGNGTEAAAADEKDLIPVKAADGTVTAEIPVTILDSAMHFALYVPEEDQWYEALITISSETIPEESFSILTPTAPEDLSLSDGLYTADVILKGGSGRASLLSPAELILEDGRLSARIIFSSSSYDYVLKNEIRYEPETLEGGSTFLIPIEGFDFDLPITADTTAMSQPHEIEYTVCFDSLSLKEVSK